MEVPKNLTTSWDFHDLMLHRVLEVLIVSSPYDAFILEQDGNLSEQILLEYLGQNLTYAPRVEQASSASEAMKILASRRFDLVISMMRMIDMDPISFGRQVKQQYPGMPVILFAFDTAEFRRLPRTDTSDAIDKAFVWSGNTNIFMAIIKYIEDRSNVRRDVEKANVGTILVVEDDPYFYSLILPTMYTEIFQHTRQVFERSINAAHRILCQRVRPKVLLASTFEEMEEFVHEFRDNLMGIVSDMRFPRAGKLDDEAGARLVRWIRDLDPNLPILLQSTTQENRKLARQLDTEFVHKLAPTALQELRDFLMQQFGLGDFVFRLPSGEEVARASDLKALQEALIHVPESSLVYHASHNHFSNWFVARSELQLARVLRPVQVSDFEDHEKLRVFLIRAIDQTRSVLHRGRIIEFSNDDYESSATITSLCGGSLGGKARGLAFIHSMLPRTDLESRFPEVTIRIPKMAVIGVDGFDEFMDVNSLWQAALEAQDDGDVDTMFLEARIPDSLAESLRIFLQRNPMPLAVRSSSLLEDSQYQSLAGLYATFYLPNCAPRLTDRLHHLFHAIKMVYASMFHNAPKRILQSSGRRPEEEKMGVVIQELAGQQVQGNRFYPTFSGMVQSLNFYPISYMKREHGVAHVVLGLSRGIREGERVLRFSPRFPAKLPQFFSAKTVLKNSQREFYCVLRDPQQAHHLLGAEDHLQKFPLEAAETDGALRWVGSVYNAQDNVFRESLLEPGPRVVSFANILKWEVMPLANVLTELLRLGEQWLGGAVEIEFAGNLYEQADRKPEFCILQIRPMAVSVFGRNGQMNGFSEDDVFCRSSRALGDDYIDSIRDIVYVKPGDFETSMTKTIAAEVGEMNAAIRGPYLLMGPGRWGTADPWLGIPAEWSQISKAKVIVEHTLDDFRIDASFGGHFFHKITANHIGYLTVDCQNEEDSLQWDWLDRFSAQRESRFVRWVRLKRPIRVLIDSLRGRGMCLKPAREKKAVMDEEDASGI